MAQPSGQLDGSSLLAEIFAKDPRHGQLLQNIIDAVNKVAQNAGVSATGEIPAPKAPDSVSVTTAGEMMHVSISHGGRLQRGVKYFSEIAASTSGEPVFSQPIVKDHGTSRTPEPFSLPTKDATGHPYSYHVRSYAQNPGGPPSAFPPLSLRKTISVLSSMPRSLSPSTSRPVLRSRHSIMAA